MNQIIKKPFSGGGNQGWTDGKPLEVIQLKPSRVQPLKACQCVDELPLCGYVIWRQIFKLPYIKGYGKQRFIRDGVRHGKVPRPRYNAEFDRYEWDSVDIRAWIQSQI